MNKKLFLKIIILLLLVAAVSASGVYFLKNKTTNRNPPAAPRKTEELSDSDFDGLPDKIEKALGTDPANWDTDGDGFSDALEIKNGYNPLVGGNGGKFSPEELNALKEKIKQADNDFYDKFFAAVPAPESEKGSSSPESAFKSFVESLKSKNPDGLLKTFNEDSLKMLSAKKIDKTSFDKTTEGLPNYLINSEYELIDQNDEFAILAPQDREIAGKKQIIAYNNISIVKNVTINQRGNIYLNKEQGFWKLDIIITKDEVIYRNLRAGKEREEAMKELRNYWMSGKTAI